MKLRVIDKLIDVVAAILGFIALIFVSIGLAGESPFRVWGTATGLALVGIAVLAVVARRWSRRQDDAPGEPSEDGELVKAEVSPVKGRVRSKLLEAMIVVSLAIGVLASYIGVGGGVSWKIWGSGLAVGVAGLVIGMAIVRREKRRDEGESGDDDA